MLIFEQDFAPHLDALYNFAYHMTCQEDLAQDLTQETALRAFKSAEKFQLGTNAKAWLFTIMRNTFINQYRSKKRQPYAVDYEKAIQEQQLPTAHQHTDLRTELFDQQMGDEVMNALAALPEPYRVIITLCDLESFAYQEIAVILDIPVGTVRSRLFRARKTLRASLNQYGRGLGYGKSDNHTEP